MISEWIRELDEAGVVRLAEALALKIRAGDVIALSGDLGAGKTTLARALIQAVLGDPAAEVPSPTFSLLQAYEAPRLTLTHFDFYRLASVDEAREIGFEEAIEKGAAIVEWPERAPALLPASRFEIALAETVGAAVRRVTFRGIGEAAAHVRRIGEVLAFLDASARFRGARISHLQGDASTRAYARLTCDEGTALLMDAPRQPDGPPIRDGKPYSEIAHLAEDVRPFSAIAGALRAAGLSVPDIYAEDLGRGLLLIEDLGDRVFGSEVAREPGRQAELWRAAVDVLVALRCTPVPEQLPLGDGSVYCMPSYDRGALQIETELLLDWYWPALHGAAVPADVRAEFLMLWRAVFDRLAQQPPGWVLRDFHSPNLIWLPERAGIRRVGVVDFQDAQRGSAAYDLVSLLQDARLDIPATLEAELLAHYGREVARREPGFDAAAFSYAYAALGAQRNTKILGIFVRLARRDGKAQYLAHLPRIWGYLTRDLSHAALAELSVWYDHHFPRPARTARLRG
ncbi:MAG: tRNA (adenosine(37)-N6)-threonylcarbamoyltransferase complex ATPase subunit type 1 TsaE [Hyphomicrobiaceae bacterium]|nr:MAG: tRNA (adenosine(37)-N6)-threonylcarbamoyltransferase complex ATPase subunit type 1 TsaE [Hyphomicrobiaceae bacterium]